MTNNDWEDFKKDVTPLKNKRVNIKKNFKNEKIITKKVDHNSDQIIIDLIETEESNLNLNQLEKNTLKKIKKGKIKIESILDLHGCTLTESKKKVANFIFESHENNKRLLLIITGKGKKKIARQFMGRKFR